MNFISILKKIGHGAEVVGKDALMVAGPAVSVAATIDPALAPVAALVSGISRSVLSAASQPNATSSDKKSTVQTAIEAVTPVLGELLLAKMGHTVQDDTRFNTGVDQCIEGILNIYKAIGAIPASTPLAVPANTATVTITATQP